MKRSLPFTYPQDLVDPFLESLANGLRQQGAIRSSQVYEAFRHVPRHLFLPFYYEQINASLCWQQNYAPEPESDPARIREWLGSVYANRARTTLLDEEQCPISSSSMPSIMAEMVEALQVEPGMRVLEIGTGTGYNAALLAYLVGPSGHVTTIDLNKSLVEQAAPLLASQAGSTIEACVGDGIRGWPANARYHRVILTARANALSNDWFEQLFPGGRLVLDLGGGLAGGLLVAEKAADDQRLEGSFLPLNVSFMPLQSTSSAQTTQLFHLLAKTAPTHIQPLDTRETFPPLLFENRMFRFFLQWHFPDATLQWWGDNPENLQPVLLAEQTLLRFIRNAPGTQPIWSIQTYGPALLWERVLQAFKDWQKLGHPELREYRIVIKKVDTAYHKRLLVYPTRDQAFPAHPLVLPIA